jgi:hypothetical protein
MLKLHGILTTHTTSTRITQNVALSSFLDNMESFVHTLLLCIRANIHTHSLTGCKPHTHIHTHSQLLKRRQALEHPRRQRRDLIVFQIPAPAQAG